MKKKNFLLIALVGTMGLAAYGSNITKGLQDFFAPIVNDKTNLPNTVPAGTIVYQSGGSAGFYGLASDGTTWVTMGLTGAVHNSWSGYHNANCTWSVSSGSFADPGSGVSGCALTQRINTGFGMVSGWGADSGTSALPGITFTPTKAGNYFVSVAFNAYDAVNNASHNWRLWDGSTVVDDSAYLQNANPSNTAGGLVTQHVVLQGAYNAANTSSVTLQIQGAVSTNVGYIVGGAGSTVQWTIYQID